MKDLQSFCKEAWVMHVFRYYKNKWSERFVNQLDIFFDFYAIPLAGWIKEYRFPKTNTSLVNLLASLYEVVASRVIPWHNNGISNVFNRINEDTNKYEPEELLELLKVINTTLYSILEMRDKDGDYNDAICLLEDKMKYIGEKIVECDTMLPNNTGGLICNDDH